MGKTIFMVCVYGGNYVDENEFEETLIATFDPDVAERYIRRYKALDRLHDRRVAALRSFEEKYCENNPRPIHDASQFKKVAKWPVGLRQQDITPEMRQERIDVDTHNHLVHKTQDALAIAWQENFEAAQIEFMKSIRVAPKRLYEFVGYSSFASRAKEWKYKVESIKVI